MVGDVTITIDGTGETFKVQQFDGQKVVRHNEPSDDVLQDHTVSHEKTKTGITRSVVRLDTNFINTAGTPELACAYVVLTHTSADGKVIARDNAEALCTWLTANTNANLVDVAAKGYGA